MKTTESYLDSDFVNSFVTIYTRVLAGQLYVRAVWNEANRRLIRETDEIFLIKTNIYISLGSAVLSVFIAILPPTVYGPK